MNGKEILQKVLALYETPSKWTQGRYARDASGKDCAINNGCCWCLSGAIQFVGGGLGGPGVRAALNYIDYALDQRVCPRSIPNFNDRIAKSVEDVKSLLREAIRRAEDLELAA